MKGMKERRGGGEKAVVVLILLCLSGIFAEEKQTKVAEISGRAAEDYSYNEFSFCLLPTEIPPAHTSFTAYLTFTFSTPPQYCDISFLQMDESNSVFMGEFRNIDQAGMSSMVVAIHDANLDFLGFDSQLFADFEFVVGSLRTPAHLLSVSLSLSAPSFLPGLANGCPNTADLPFQLFPFFPSTLASSVDFSDSNSESEMVENNLDQDTTHDDDDKVTSSSSDHTSRNYDIAFVLSFLFVIMIVVSCASTAYVIAVSIRNDPSGALKRTNQRRVDGEEDVDDERDVPEREFLV